MRHTGESRSSCFEVGPHKVVFSAPKNLADEPCSTTLFRKQGRLHCDSAQHLLRHASLQSQSTVTCEGAARSQPLVPCQMGVIKDVSDWSGAMNQKPGQQRWIQPTQLLQHKLQKLSGICDHLISSLFQCNCNVLITIRVTCSFNKIERDIIDCTFIF